MSEDELDDRIETVALDESGGRVAVLTANFEEPHDAEEAERVLQPLEGIDSPFHNSIPHHLTPTECGVGDWCEKAVGDPFQFVELLIIDVICRDIFVLEDALHSSTFNKLVKEHWLANNL